MTITVLLVLDPQTIVSPVFPQESTPQNVPVHLECTKTTTRLVLNVTSNVPNVPPLLTVPPVEETEFLKEKTVSAQPELSKPITKTVTLVVTNVTNVLIMLPTVLIVLPTESTNQPVPAQKELITLKDKPNVQNVTQIVNNVSTPQTIVPSVPHHLSNHQTVSHQNQLFNLLRLSISQSVLLKSLFVMPNVILVNNIQTTVFLVPSTDQAHQPVLAIPDIMNLEVFA